MKSAGSAKPCLYEVVRPLFCMLVLLMSGRELHAQGQPALQISSPAAGTVLNPGQTVSVTVTSPAGVTFTDVAVIGELPIGLVGRATSVPATVSSTIPTSTSPGQYMLTATGLTSAGQVVTSATILIGVERPDVPVSLSVVPNRLLLQSQGQRQPLSVSATFSDGAVLDVTHSANLIYSSSNTSVVTVDSSGLASGTGQGGAILTAAYGQGPQATIPAIVAPSVLASSPATLTFATQNMWASSSPQALSVSNVSQNAGLTIGAVTATGDFSESDNCVSQTPLALNATCTVNVTFTPTASGSRTGAINIANSATAAPFVVALAGTGTAPASAPSIAALSPTSGLVGTSVTISGANFGATQGNSTVAFNGAAATPSSWSMTGIVASVPTGATTGNVTVTVAGQPSNGVNFIVSVAPPVISTLSRTSGAVGAGVTITGTNFGATQGTSTVSFNGVIATPTSWSSTSIGVTVPNGATTGNVLVTTAAQASNGVGFTVVPAASITSLSPTSGPVGTSVTITGANFGSTQSNSSVTFNGTAATPTTWSSTSIVVPVPTGATTGNVVVSVGGVGSNGVTFTVTGGTTTISLVQHKSIDAGTTTSASLAFSSNNTAGNWIAVCIRAGLSSSQVFTVTDSRHNTYHKAVQLGFTSSAVTMAIYYAENVSAGGNTVEVSDTVSGPLRFAIFEYSGVATSNSLDVVATEQATSTSPHSENFTTTANGDLLLVAVATVDAENFTVGSGCTVEEFVPAEPNTKLIVEDRIQSTAGTTSSTATLGASDPWALSVATFKKAP